MDWERHSIRERTFTELRRRNSAVIRADARPWNTISTMRLDQWLDISCLFKTRSEAQKACKGGKVDVNGQAAKPHREVHPGDEIVISRPLGRKQRVVVVGEAEQHIPK